MTHETDRHARTALAVLVGVGDEVRDHPLQTVVVADILVDLGYAVLGPRVRVY